ncbi:hypothetical protein LSH36_361g02006 [Paralvinella palmiformis]|uniref:RING-type domain-containing protein n=1 Tax=Paralvinella palmiformis TaxID=53620 RepID=A0AAD9JE51_9ANNE|nr:hypothetical protein LSH36_361g02006 [Paralvinella palmiformis]
MKLQLTDITEKAKHLGIIILQVISLCWQCGLYDAILYIYNKGMQDYITPLDEVMALLIAAVQTNKKLTDSQIKLGNKLLVYISCCLAGRAYPFGDIPPEHVSRVKEEVFKRVTCLHSPNCNEDEPAYPYLKALLRFDTREFFNVLAMAFEEPEFASVEGLNKRQRIVDILLQIMVESIGFSATQIGTLFTFLARQMARHENTIMVNRVLFEQVLESLCSSPDGESESRHEERQQALIELLNAGGLEHFSEERLLRLTEHAKFYRVCESLYQKRKEYDKILSCYWKDPARKHQSFSYIEHILMSDYYSVEDKQKIEREAVSHIMELVSIDNKKTAQLVLNLFHCSLNDIITRLNKDEQLLLKFLDGIFEHSSSNIAYSETQFNVEPSIHERYIELLCKYEISKVYPYIQQAEGYRLDKTLEICRRYDLSEVVAFLLEKSGDVQGAFDLIMEMLQNRLTDLILVTEGSNSADRKPEDDLAACWKNVKMSLHALIQLCQRNSTKMEEDDKQALWFPLLDVVMGSQRRMKDMKDKSNQQDFKELTREVLNSMMGYIPLQSILQKLLQDPTYSSGKFGEVKDLLLGMLDTCNYEKTLLSTCNNLVNHDLYRQLAMLCITATRGIVPKQEACNICSKLLTNIPDSVICFRCGHIYHLACLHSTSSANNMNNETTWMCYICNKTKQRGCINPRRMKRLPSSSQPQKVTAKVILKSRKPEAVALESEQIQAIDSLRRVQKTSSRLAILSELARQERAGGPSKYKLPPNSIFRNEQFQLRLAPPPPDFQ